MKTSAAMMRIHVERAVARAKDMPENVLGDRVVIAFAELGELAVAWADELEALYTTPGRDVKAAYDAQAALLRALLPPGSEALRRLP